MFTIKYHRKVLKKDFKGLSKSTLSMLKKVIEEKLSQDPFRFGKPLRNTLKNTRSLRVGKYRIVYEIKENELVVLVLKLGTREKVYEEVEKRLK